MELVSVKKETFKLIRAGLNKVVLLNGNASPGDRIAIRNEQSGEVKEMFVTFVLDTRCEGKKVIGLAQIYADTLRFRMEK